MKGARWSLRIFSATSLLISSSASTNFTWLESSQLFWVLSTIEFRTAPVCSLVSRLHHRCRRWINWSTSDLTALLLACVRAWENWTRLQLRARTRPSWLDRPTRVNERNHFKILDSTLWAKENKYKRPARLAMTNYLLHLTLSPPDTNAHCILNPIKISWNFYFND